MDQVEGGPRRSFQTQPFDMCRVPLISQNATTELEPHVFKKARAVPLFRFRGDFDAFSRTDASGNEQAFYDAVGGGQEGGVSFA